MTKAINIPAKRIEAPARTSLQPVAKARTLRLGEEHEAGLKILKSVSGMPVRKMVNEAVGEYLEPVFDLKFVKLARASWLLTRVEKCSALDGQTDSQVKVASPQRATCTRRMH